MGIYGCLSLKKTVSGTHIYDRKHRNLRVSRRKFNRSKTRRISSREKIYALGDNFSQKQQSILDEILDESSSDESEKDFEDFIKIISHEKETRNRNILLNKILPNVLAYSLDHSQYSRSSFFDVTEMHNKVNNYYRAGSSSSRNTPGSFYCCDFYRKPKTQRREIKPFMNMYSINHCFDNSSKYRSNRPRSVSPNLPKIPYLEKPPQYICPSVSTQRKPRLIFKTKLNKDNQTPIKNASKKSIPDHALMKNLLSGLSIFENEDEIRGSNSKNIHKHKSMGNIRSMTRENYSLKGSCKSNVDVRESTGQNSQETIEHLKDYYNNHKQVHIKQCLKDDKSKCYQINCSCIDSHQYNKNTNEDFTKEKGDINCNCQIVSKEKSQRCSTLVERRRHFFENRKRQLELENIKSRPTTLVINCIQKKIQDDFEKPDDITEIYRNFRGVQSNSTISKRSSSLPPISRFRNYNGRNGELFNPDYNFCCENNSGSSSLKNSIIESIRSKVFQRNNLVKKDSDDDWNPKPIHMPKFPKETRTAMSIILSNKNSSISCKLCREKFHKRQLAHIHTQTSPQTSKCKIPESSGDIPNLPCPKNLLCGKGCHSGECEESATRKLVVVCDENCICRESRRMFACGDMSIWPGQAVRLQEDCIENMESCPENFLVLIRPDLDTSEERIDNQLNESSSGPTIVTMNGLNGHTNGDLNGCGDIITQNQQRGCWTVGLINSKYRYLTAETFGFKINANGASLKKKQIWTLEPDASSGSETCVYLKSHLDKYLAVDSFGNVTCESDEKEAGSKFQVTVSEDSTGRWAFRNVVRGYFLGSSSDKLTCTAKAPTDSEYWHIHLAARPQMNLRSVGRKRFAHLSENLDEIHVDANIPWGEDTLFTLEFRADEDGKYALHTCNNKYLSNGGKLVDTCNKDCLFAAEYHSGQLALRDRNGQYLSPIGSKAVLKTRSNTVTKDELFSLEDSLPQASFVAALNSRYVSVKQGVDVTANQDEISSHEMFQLEFDWSTKRWYIRTMQDKYWTLETGGGIQASGDKRSSNALFDLVWQGDGSLAFRANNGRYVITKRSGHLYATSDVIDENCKYYFYLINRPILVLKCEQGFVGYKSASSPKLECNKATYECIQVERAEKGIIYFKDHNGKYWHVDSEGVTADSDTPEGFYLELREPTRLCIKTTIGNYLTASKNGLFRMGDSSIENATQWEY